MPCTTSTPPFPWENSSEQNVIARRFVFCPFLHSNYPLLSDRIKVCPGCNSFSAVCCKHAPQFCHHYALVFIDGACLSNGMAGATAGLGVAMGLVEGDEGWSDLYANSESDEESLNGSGDDERPWQKSIPVTDEIDPGQKRSSQRAELLAALVGVDMMYPQHEHHPMEKRSIIITTDSEYVVKGMTEWFPSWKNNNWRTKSGKRPSNLDLFLKLDSKITKRETEEDIKIGFWHVPRRLNTIADRLAKEAALKAKRLDVVF